MRNIPNHLLDSQKDHESKSQCPFVTIKPSVHASIGLDGSDGEYVYLDSSNNPVQIYINIPYISQVVLMLGISDVC